MDPRSCNIPNHSSVFTHHGPRARLRFPVSRDYPKGAMEALGADIPASIFLTTFVWTLGCVYVKMLIPQTTTTNDNPDASHANCDRRAVRPRRVNESSDRMVLFHEKAASIVPCTKNLVNIGRSSSKFQSFGGTRHVHSQWAYIRSTGQLFLSDKHGMTTESLGIILRISSGHFGEIPKM